MENCDSEKRNNKSGQCELRDQNINFGTSINNLGSAPDIWGEGDRDVFYVQSTCSKIYVHAPGEHVVNGVEYDMEIQIFCEGVPLFVEDTTKQQYLIAIPVKQTSNKTEESKFFKNMSIENIKDKGDIIISGIEKVLNEFSTTKGLITYYGSESFPNCKELTWIYLYGNNLVISLEKLNKFKEVIMNEFAPTGNNRVLSDPITNTDFPVYDINFGK